MMILASIMPKGRNQWLHCVTDKSLWIVNERYGIPDGVQPCWNPINYDETLKLEFGIVKPYDYSILKLTVYRFEDENNLTGSMFPPLSLPWPSLNLPEWHAPTSAHFHKCL